MARHLVLLVRGVSVALQLAEELAGAPVHGDAGPLRVEDLSDVCELLEVGEVGSLSVTAPTPLTLTGTGVSLVLLEIG